MNITPKEFDKLMSEYSQERNPDDVWVIYTNYWDFLCSIIISDLLPDDDQTLIKY